jgi:hypothetical protein
MREFALSKIASIPKLFREEPSADRCEIRKRMREVWMTTVRNAEGNRYYIGVCQWNLVDDDFTSSLRHIFDLIYERRKTGVRSLAVLLPSSTEALSDDHVFWQEIQNTQSVEREWDTTCSGFMKWLQNRNATGAWLNCGVQSVAGAGFEPATFGL